MTAPTNERLEYRLSYCQYLISRGKITYKVLQVLCMHGFSTSDRQKALLLFDKARYKELTEYCETVQPAFDDAMITTKGHTATYRISRPDLRGGML